MALINAPQFPGLVHGFLAPANAHTHALIALGAQGQANAASQQTGTDQGDAARLLHIA